jgi:hypothetical protein
MKVVPAWKDPTRMICGEEWAYYTLKVTRGSTPVRAGMFVCPALGLVRVAKGFVGSHPVKGSRDQLVEYNPQEQDWSNLSKTLEQELASQAVEAEEAARGATLQLARGAQPPATSPASGMSCHGGAGAAASSSNGCEDGRLQIAAPGPEGGPAAAGAADLAAAHASSERKKQRRVPHVWVYVRK